MFAARFVAVELTLDVFSGRQNPHCVLDRKTEDEVLTRLGRLAVISGERIPLEELGLGYRGFELTVDEGKVCRQLHVFGNRVWFQDSDETFVDESNQLERVLLVSPGLALDSAFRAELEAEIESAPDGLTSADKPMFPRYEPGRWNGSRRIKRKNNCYNYAADRITNTYAQPGRGGGHIYGKASCESLDLAAQRDGWRPINSLEDLSQLQLLLHPVFLCRRRDKRDYHWYRLDDNGTWSHKLGPRSVRNVDQDGRRIHDPRTCNRGQYSRQCQFYQYIPGRMRIK